MNQGPVTFAGGTLDRAAPRRADAAWLAAAREDPRARALLVGADGVALEGAVPKRGAPADGAPFLGVDPDGAALFVSEPAAGTVLTGLREAADLLSAADAGLVAYASALLHWHRSHRHCGVCGAPTEQRDGGHARVCVNGHSHHPRTDPVVIMLVANGDRLLLGRRPIWPEGRYSCLAGYVEPGESLESAVAREVREEAAVEVGAVHYRMSQPWPFPLSLMLGFEAEYASGDARVADDELEDVRWFSREQLAGGATRLPPRTTIARRLIERWLAS